MCQDSVSRAFYLFNCVTILLGSPVGEVVGTGK